MTSEKTKHCSKCGTTLPLDQFYIRSGGKVNPWCKSCYHAWYRQRYNVQNPQYEIGDDLVCAHCGETFARRQRRPTIYCSKRCGKKARVQARKPDRNCLYCDKTMPRSMRADARFCSEQCNSNAHQVTRQMAVRARVARPDELVARSYIFTRDKWTCGLCGKPVSRTKRHPDPLAGSIDHIVPIAMGGTNDLTNLQLAHLRCNWEKRQHGGGQLRLLG